MDVLNSSCLRQSCSLKLILFSLLTYLFTNFSFSQASEKAYSMVNNPETTLPINYSINKNEQIDLSFIIKKISGLAISAEIRLNSDTSLIRIILLDEEYNEYLVYEIFPLLGGENSISIENVCEETSQLNNITPLSLKFEIVDASFFLRSIAISKEANFSTKAQSDKFRLQQSDKISRINENIKKQGLKWVAGETSVSVLSYQEKKNLFGGKIPNLQGFEYYKGGIFTLPGPTNFDSSPESSELLSQHSTESPYVNEFSWRNRHGQNWVTSIKNQGGCGGCWAFAAVGAVELLVNLYYNQHIDLDLSEQDIISCSNSGTCNGGDYSSAMNYIISKGVVNESCFPYMSTDLACTEKCMNPSEQVKINAIGPMIYSGDQLKGEIIKGAMSGRIDYWHHAMALVGFKVIQENDELYVNDKGNIIELKISSGNSLIGKTAWLFKNSWGNWGDEGYVYVVGDTGSISANNAYGPIHAKTLSDEDILCTDNDHDGYYVWGLGYKPSQCPICPDEQDGDDSNPCMGPMDEYGHIQSQTPVPSANNIEVMVGQTVPPLIAQGENIKWYEDRYLTKLVHTGSQFNTGRTAPGKYFYYATQTISGCESFPIETYLKIELPKPVGYDVSIRYGIPVPDLTALGQNIKWYFDSTGLFSDVRDNQEYNTITIDRQIWMAKNLNYYTPVGSWYYNMDSITYSETYGRLYNWETARNVCPSGFHLPSDEEWQQMEHVIGLTTGELDCIGYRGHTEGGKLKEKGTGHWVFPNSYATDSYSFKALPGGHSGFNEPSWYLGKGAHFWTRSIQDSSYAAYTRFLTYNNGGILRYFGSFSEGMSVRCVKENTAIGTGNIFTTHKTSPGKYTYFVTQTISGYESPSDTVTLVIITPPPDVHNVKICEGDSVPDLFVDGENIKWYDDYFKSNLINTGNSYHTGHTVPGNYKYFVTQTIDDVESLLEEVSLIIVTHPPAPYAENVKACSDNIPSLWADGVSLSWYGDAELTNLLCRNGTYYFATGETEPGIYAYYVTQTYQEVCESSASNVTLEIVAMPQPPLASDESTCAEDAIHTLTALGENIRWYGDLPSDPFTDYRTGQTYKIVKIGTQIWMAENLNFPTKVSEIQYHNSWYYDNDSITNASIYGRLYSFTIANSACPGGWKIPTIMDWDSLINYLGGTDQAGGKLKDTGTCFWNYPNAGATNETGFTALPGGIRRFSYCADSTCANYEDLNNAAYFWSNTNSGRGESAYAIRLINTSQELSKSGIHKYNGLSVRCIWDGIGIIDTGNVIYISQTHPGRYNYYATQTISGCESQHDTAILTVYSVPEPPDVNDTNICANSPTGELYASGENIQWYNDSELIYLIHAGNHLSISNMLPGNYEYYVSQTVTNCESHAAKVEIEVNSLPVINLGEDITISYSQDTTITAGYNDLNYYWNTGENTPEIVIKGSEIGLGNHEFNVVGIDSNNCSNSDTIIITVIASTMVKSNTSNQFIQIYPNPVKNYFFINLNNLKDKLVLIKLYNETGEEVYREIADIKTSTQELRVDMAKQIYSIYYLVIITEDNYFTYKIILL